MLFEDWWRVVITTLDHGLRLRDWTPLNGLTAGEFTAWSGRSLTKREQSFLNSGHPFDSPDDWLVCTQVKGERPVPVSKEEFRERYDSWPAYRDNKIVGKDFEASPYVISIFYHFNGLLSLELTPKE